MIRHSRFADSFHHGEPRDGLSYIVKPPPWTVDALCTQFPPDLFFPEKGGTGAREAKAVCAKCPVIDQCLAYALDYEAGVYGTDTSYVHQGVWGGKSPRERMRLRRLPNQEPAA